jgi:chemotaxis protein CheD
MDDHLDKTMQYVNTGQVKSGGIETILNSGAIGSCVVIIAFDQVKHVGAMAHVMLPGKSPQTTTNATRYASNAIEELLNQLFKRGVKKENIEVCMVGGANVLKRKNDTIGVDNITSVEKLLQDLHLRVCAKSIGGTERRTTNFPIEAGCIYFTEGDSKERLLWDFNNRRKN